MRTANFKSAAIAALLSMGLLTGCTNGITNQKTSNHMDTLNLTQEWDKKFPQSDKVNHRKVTFKNRYGITLAADLYEPKNIESKLPAIAVSGPFGAVKEQSSGLYAQTMAERGFLTLAFDPSYTGESGGEPRNVASPDINTEDFSAAVDFLIDLFKKAKEQGVHTNIDTSGAVFTKEEPFFGKLQELLKYTDMLMLDIKHIDDEQHKILTGQSNKNILEFARYLSDIKKPIWIRHVLVPERSDKDEYLERLHDFIETLDNVERVEVLPYHTLGAYKWKELGYDYKLEGIDPPTQERIENANRILETAKYLK